MREEKLHYLYAKAEAAKYRRELKDCRTEEERKALMIACGCRIKDMKESALSFDGGDERKRMQREIRRFALRVALINLFTGISSSLHRKAAEISERKGN